MRVFTLTTIASAAEAHTQQPAPLGAASSPTAARVAAVVYGGSPAVSPDGKTVLFSSNRDGAWGVYVVNPDGTGERRLNADDHTSVMADWAGDSRHVWYLNSKPGADAGNVYEIDIASRERQLVRAGGAFLPVLSPDRRTIVFAAGAFPNVNLYLSSITDTARRPVTHEGLNFGVAISPDGKRIAFSSTKVVGVGPKIYVANIDGTGMHQVSSGEGADEHPAWSPDGRSIAFFSSIRGRHYADVYVVSADGSAPQRKVTTHAEDYLIETPSWFPDGKSLAVQSDRDGAMSVYVIDLQGNVLRRLTAPATLEDSLIAREKASWEAWKGRDGTFFSDFLSDDHVEMGAGGPSSKTVVVAGVASKACVVASYSVDRFNLTQFNATSALLTYHAAQDTKCGATAVPSPVWVSSFYVLRNSKWLNAAYQQTPEPVKR